MNHLSIFFSRYTKSIIRLSRINRTIPIQGYSTTYQELEYNYNYHIRYKSQVQKIKEQLEQESQQLIKNLILSNQINQITPTQIKIQF